MWHHKDPETLTYLFNYSKQKGKEKLPSLLGFSAANKNKAGSNGNRIWVWSRKTPSPRWKVLIEGQWNTMMMDGTTLIIEFSRRKNKGFREKAKISLFSFSLFFWVAKQKNFQERRKLLLLVLLVRENFATPFYRERK